MAKTDMVPSEAKVTKGERTRERILEAALDLFARKGYNAATMRDIAAEAGCSLGLAYRYFASKEEMVLALYERLAAELEEEVAALPSASLAERWARAERAELARLEPHRESLAALFGAGLSVDSPTQVLGPGTRELRTRVRGVYGRLLTGASDAPRGKAVEHLTTLLYASHLSLVLFWLQDRTPDQKATGELIAFGRDMLARLRPVLGLPFVARQTARLATIMTPLFGAGEADEGGSDGQCSGSRG
ncbi:MAG TPA: TetR/AcrR family transcriptional regulator [Armatimonadaceae bacterium]|nr:TetR/AcrR family transcriptional regulator [Armatimonadaceae bacterium]